MHDALHMLRTDFQSIHYSRITGVVLAFLQFFCGLP